MGTYYLVANHKNKEYLEPGEIDGFGIKYGAMVYGNIGKLIVSKLINHEWDTVSIVDDSSNDELFTEIENTYKNITEETVKLFNANVYDVADRIIYKSYDQQEKERA